MDNLTLQPRISKLHGIILHEKYFNFLQMITVNDTFYLCRTKI